MNPDINILGIDTATAVSAVCVWCADGSTFETPPPAARLRERPAQAVELMPSIDRELSRAGLRWRDLHRVAVGVGPGAYTGLRIGIAAARAIAAGLEIEIVPVSSLAALAVGAIPEADQARTAGVPSEAVAAAAEIALTVIDARRGELFVAAYRVDGPRVAELLVARVAPASEVIEIARSLAARSADPGSVIAVGDAVESLAEDLAGAGVSAPKSDSTLHLVRGRSVCRLAASATPLAIAEVTPNYLRLPDAEISLRAREAGAGAGVNPPPHARSAPDAEGVGGGR